MHRKRTNEIRSFSVIEVIMLQIQPLFKNITEYEALCEKYGLNYEVLEFSMGNAATGAEDYYKNCGRVKSIHGAFIDVNPGSSDAAFRELSEKRCSESCDLAMRLGAENVVFHSSCFPFLRGAYIENWAALCADFYTRLAEQYPALSLLIENSLDIDPVPIKMLTDKISAGNVGVCLDIGHINYSRAALDEWFEVLGDRVRYLHISDNYGIYDDHITLGSGTVDWAKASRLTKYLPAETPVTLEVGGIESIESSVEFLKANGFFGGLI